MIKNSYIASAENDLAYLESVLGSGSTFYNQLSVDKLLVEEDNADLLRKHNMKKMAAKLNERVPGLQLDTIGLAYLTDFYFDARYPGDDFYTVSKEEFEKCLSVMYDTVRKLQGIG